MLPSPSPPFFSTSTPRAFMARSLDARLASSTASFASEAATTRTNGTMLVTGETGETGERDRAATPRKYRLATRRNCSNRPLGRKVAGVYLVVRRALD